MIASLVAVMGAKVHLKIKRLPRWGMEGEDFSGAMGGGPILLELISPHCGSAYKFWREDLPVHNAHPGHQGWKFCIFGEPGSEPKKTLGA